MAKIKRQRKPNITCDIGVLDIMSFEVQVGYRVYLGTHTFAHI